MAQNESYYRDRREHYEGRVVMFRRPDSWHRGEDRIWQVRFKLEGLAGYKTVSLKTPIYEVACHRSWYWEHEWSCIYKL